MHAPRRSARAREAARLRRASLAIALAALVAAGCGSGGTTRRTLTERERDSTLGRSAIPGAGVVTRALEESDRARNAAQELDRQVESSGP